MRYLLACLVFVVNTGALAQSGPSPVSGAGSADLAVPHFASSEAERGAASARRAELRLLDPSPDGAPSGHGDGASMTPMWVMMGVMMVGMMVVLGARMMRAHGGTSLQLAAQGSPAEAAVPPAIARWSGG